MKIHKISILALSLAAVGCAGEVAEWTPAESPKHNKIQRFVSAYDVHYPAHAKDFKKDEKEKLNRFLKTNVPSPAAVLVTLEEYGGHSEGRVKDVRRELLKHGVPFDLIQVPESAWTGKDASKHGREDKKLSGVEVVVERYVVIPPSCADFSQQIGTATQAEHASNYGCSTEANIGMMVANPRDLLKGREHGPYDGTVMAAGVQRYHEDRVKKLIDTSTTIFSQSGDTQEGTMSLTTSGGQ